MITAHMPHQFGEMFHYGMEHVVYSQFGKTAYGKDLTELNGNLVRQVLVDHTTVTAHKRRKN